MLSLFPAIQPFATRHVAVPGGHSLYVEECGNPSGLPVVFLHGGPGSGCEEYQRRFFDPQVYRIILFDQRGCGRSKPHAQLENNTTQELVADIEQIRELLGVEKWVVFGGSWGSTLGLVYAEAHPERVLGLILRGVFLCRDEDIHWFYQHGASRIYPDYWQDFLAQIPPEERDQMVRAYYSRLTGPDEVARMAAAKAWSIWEGRCACLRSNRNVLNHFGDPFTALSLARIECHYFINRCFLEPSHILANASRLEGIPGTIVHGRYDMVCPVDQAWDLHQAWPGAQLRIIGDAGHSASEPGIVDALVKATGDMAMGLQQ